VPYSTRELKQLLIHRKIVDYMMPGESTGDDDETADWSVYDPPASRAIVEVKHRLKDGLMTVRFRNGPIDYLFLDVPRELFRQWKRVGSAGKFYHRRIKNNFNMT